MAIQAKMCPDVSGFGLVDWAGGGGLNGDGMGLNLQQRQNQQMLHFQNRMMHEQSQYGVADTSSFGGVSQSIGFDSVVEKQSFEIDRYVRSQSERLRHVLREQRKREVTELIRKIEARTSVLLKLKDEEIARAANRTSQLESLVLKLQNEAQTWQQIARQNEVHVVNLRNSIQMLQQSAFEQGGVQDGVYGGGAMVDDSESCCDESDGGVEMVCRICQSREGSVVLLPCRHMCCCAVCVSMVEFCPLCQTTKKATVEALFH